MSIRGIGVNHDFLSCLILSVECQRTKLNIQDCRVPVYYFNIRYGFGIVSWCGERQVIGALNDWPHIKSSGEV